MTRATRPAAEAARRPSPHPRSPEHNDEDVLAEREHAAEPADRDAEGPLKTDPSVHSEPKARIRLRLRLRRGRWFWLLALLSVVTVALLGLTGWLYGQVSSDDAARADRENVALAARQGALNLTGLSHTDADAAYTRLLQGTTGGFHDQLSQQAASFKQALAQGQVVSSGQITEAGVERLSGDDATALVVPSANVKNTQAPQGENRQYRLQLTLHREGGQWLISELEFVG